jgi:glycosyltransferase involved in cell wall biosynthesis
MEILLSPASYFFTDSVPYGEGLVCYNFVKNLPHIKFHVVSPNVDVKRVPENVRIYEIKGYNNPFNPSVLKTVGFAPQMYRISKSILSRENVDIIHHFLPVQYPRIVNLLPFNKSIMEKYPFVIGPVIIPTRWPRNGLENQIDFFSQLLFKKCIKEADVIIAQTEHARDLIKSVVPEGNVVVVPLGVDTNTFKPTNSPHTLEILTVAHLLPIKGIEYLIRAIPYVKKDFPNVILRIIGEGPREQYLRNLANSLALSRNVVFNGYVSYDKLAQFYNQATIFCFPFLGEGLGVVILEAMACGKPIIATKNEGTTQVIRHGTEGFLFDPANPESIADSLLTLLHNPDLIKKMGAKARETCLKKYSWSAVAKIYSKIYHSL